MSVVFYSFYAKMKNYKDVDWIGHMAVRKELDKSLVLLMKSQEDMSQDVVSCDAIRR